MSIIKKYYPWIVCAAGVLLHICACGMTTVGFSAYLPYLKESLELTGTETSMITTIRCLTSMIFMMFAGTYYKKFSLRAGVCVASLLVPVSCVIFANAGSVWACYVGAAVMGTAYAFGTMIPLALIIRNWFKTYASTALSITACGSGITTMLMPPIITRLVENIDLKTTFYIESIFCIVIVLILYIIIRDQPSQLNMEPFYLESRKEAAEKKKMAHRDLKSGEALFFIVAILMIGCSGTPYTHHLSLHYTTIGYTAIQAAAALSFYGAILTFSKILYGYGTDRFGSYRVNFLFFGAWIAASTITALLNGSSMSMLYLTSVLNGIGVPLGTIGITIWSGDLSSEEQYAKRLKFSQAVFQLGSLVGSTIPGILADISGDYRSSYILFAILLFLSCLIIQILYFRHVRNR